MKRKKVVIFLLNNNGVPKVLLGLKTKKIGEGLRNGYGGGIKKGESPSQAAARELEEELGVIAEAEDFIDRGRLMITSRKGGFETQKCELYIFILKKWEGEFRESVEMEDPRWFNIRKLPEKMISSDKLWLPSVLQGKKVEGSISSNSVLGTLNVELSIENSLS